MEIESELMREIKKILERMYRMNQLEDWSESDAQSLISDGADLFASYFRNNN